MGLREQIRQNAAASQQAMCIPSGCKACQRTGLPLFPLRVAAVPKALLSSSWKSTVPKQEVELTGGEFKYALRTLRMGYVYILLDKTVWQGYEVTAEGYLRQFNPLAMPEGETVNPLSKSCLQHGHEISASFINIDDNKYSEAWLAFSRDPWSQEVLDGYKSAERPDSRFTKISLVTLKNCPASIPEALVLEPSLASLKANVVEFATDFFANNPERLTGEPHGGAHGFYPRLDSEMALGLRIAQLGTQHRCQIVSLALNDSVGVVQELNNSRMQNVEAKQEYLEQPGVFHKYMISKAITNYFNKIKESMAKNAHPRFDVEPSMYILAGPSTNHAPKMISKEQVAEEMFTEQLERLMKSYDEPARAVFTTEFERRFTWSEEHLAAIDTDLAAWYQAPGWLAILTHDYSPDTLAASWAAQMQTLAACVQGGAMGKETEKVWTQWLQQADSPAYLGFTGMDSSLLGTVFNYGDFKTVATSDEFGLYLKSVAIQRSWAIRMLAVSGTVSRLGKAVTEAPRKGFMWMMQAAMLTAGESVVVLRYQTTFRALQKHLRHSAALQQSMIRNGPTLSASGGSMLVVDEIKGMRGKGLNTPLWVEFSVPGTLAKLKNELPGFMEKPFNNPAMLDKLHDVYLSELSLAEKGTTGPVLKASYAHLAKYGEWSRRVVSGDSAGLILGTGLMAMQLFNLSELTDRLNKSVGTDTDVVADMTINTLLMMGGFSELSGFASKLVVKKNWVVLGAAGQVPGMVRFGAVLGGIAGIVDGIRDGANSLDAYKTKDYGVSGLLFASTLVKIIGGSVGIRYGAQGIFALASTAKTGFLGLGPAGWAAILLITGTMLAYEASKLRSTAFETWLRRTCFGIEAKRHADDIAWHADNMSDLAEALVDYRAIVSGMVADVAFASVLSVTGRTTIDGVAYERVDLRVSLPGWGANRGGWLVSLHRAGDGKVLFSQSVSAPGRDDHYQAVEPAGYYQYSLAVNEETVEDGGEQKTANSLNLMVSVWTEQSRTTEVTLVASYWPDKTDAEYQMGLTVSKQG